MNKNFTKIQRTSIRKLWVKTVGCLLMFGAAHVATAQPSGKYGPEETTYEIPAGAYFASPEGKGNAPCSEGNPCSFSNALQKVPRGGTIVLKGGVYRTSTYNTVIKRKMTIQPYPGEEVIIKGSEIQKSWTATGSFWKAKWDNLYGKPGNDNGRAVGLENPMADHRDMVFINGAYQKQVESIAMLGPGKFYIDYNNKMVYLGSNPSGKEVEISAEWWGLSTYGCDEKEITIRGLKIMHYTDAAIFIGSPAAVVENNEVVWNGAAGIRVQHADDVLLKGNSFSYNACQGGGFAYTDRIQVINNSFVENNYEDYNRNSWSASGIKVLWTKNAFIKNNLFKDNDSNGLWLDERCNGSILVGNRVHNSSRIGIHCEISNDVIIAGNVVSESGLSKKYIGSGISVVNSSEVRVYNNTLYNNEVALDVVEITRGDEKDPNDPYITRNTVVKNNIFSGAFIDEYPSALYYMKKKKCEDNAIAEQDNNAYYRPVSGTPSLAVRWKVNYNSCNDEERLETVQEFKTKLGHDKNGFGMQGGEEPFFINPQEGDFRLKSTALTIKSGAPLPADVAEALGWEKGVVVDIGAYQTNISQTPTPETGSLPWEETFTTSDGATNDNGLSDGSAWDLNRGNISSNAAFKVDNNRLVARGTVGEANWFTETIDIENHIVNVSLMLYSQGALEDKYDFVKVYYKLDGVVKLLKEVKGNIGSNGTKVELNGIKGKELELLVQFKNSDYTELYFLDNVKVNSAGSTLPKAEITKVSVVDKTIGISSTQMLTVSNEIDISRVAPENLDVLAEANGDVGSVVFDFDGKENFRADNEAPYYLFEETPSTFTIGENHVKVKVYSEADGKGELLSEKDFTFILKETISREASVRWFEDFTLRNGLKKDEGATAWSFQDAYTSQSRKLFEVKDNTLWLSETSSKNDQGYVIWKSELINIEGQDAMLSLDVMHSGKMENDKATGDYLKVEYKVDGQPLQSVFSQYGGFENENKWYSFEKSGISGKSLQVIISARTTTNTESYFVDNIKVTEYNVERPVQILPWSEDFEQTGNVTQEQGISAWFFSQNQRDFYSQFGVEEGSLYISRNDNPVRWFSYPIDIKDSKVDISFDVKESGRLEATGAQKDYLNIFYRIDGGAWEPLLEQDGNFKQENTWLRIEEKGLEGERLEVMIEGRTSADSETFYVDNINIKGEYTVPTLQVLPWVENFSGADNTSMQNDETAWYFEYAGSDEVQNFGIKEEQIYISQSTKAVRWQSGLIDISSADKVQLSFDIKEKGNLEATGNTKDYLNVYYSVDGGEPRYAVQHNGNLSKDDQWYTIIEEGIEGSTLTLYIEGQTSTLSESYHVDNIEVFATQNPVEEEEEEEEIYSVLTIYAAGKSGYEQMELRIDGKTVKAWDGIGGNVYDPIFEEYVYEHKGEKLKASQIQIVYVNDAGYQPYTGIRVGKIEIDGEVFETEASTTYGVGVYSDGECREGYMQSESLECGGYFRYMASEIKSYHLDINAFPNPAKDIQMLEFATNLDKVDVKIIDMQGVVKINYTGVNTADVLQLDLSTLHAGIYVIQVSSSSTYSETRIYKE